MCISFYMHLGTDNIPTNSIENENQLIIQAAFLRVNQPLPMALYCNDFNVCHWHSLYMFLILECMTIALFCITQFKLALHEKVSYKCFSEVIQDESIR